MENMEQVLLSGNHYLGTVRVNKKGLPPKEFHFPRTGRNKRQRGEMIQMKTTLLNGTNIYFIAWHDNKPVHMISSIPAVKTLCTRVVRNPDGSWDPNRKIPRPSNVAIYNCGMGGTDAIDQRVSYYRPNVKCTSAWYQRTFIHIIVLCCINAYIIYYLYLNLDRKEYTYLDFLRQLISELADDELEKKRHNTNAKEETSKTVKSLKSWEKVESRLRGVHMPKIIEEERLEWLNKEENTTIKRNLKRGNCLVCL